MSEDMAGGLPGIKATELPSPARCWASVLHTQTPNGNSRTLVHVLTSTSSPHRRVKKKQRRSSHLHLPSQCLSPWAAAMRMDWTLVWWVGTWPQVSGAGVWNTAALAPGRKRHAIYQHQVSELILVTFENSLSMGIKVVEKEFFYPLHTSRSNYYCQIKQV